ncbi:MAG: peptide ABC transporter substrate-binding protein [Bacillota bacterium]|nr:peptide ABC transporter substrate-binding protein [Bacillota bacterium]
MLKNKTTNLISSILSVIIFGTLVTGCANVSNKNQNQSTKQSLADNQLIRYNLGADPKTIDPGLNDALYGGTVICNAFEGLMRLDSSDKPIPGAAEKYEVSSDQLHYTFHLRKDAKWSDGQPVKASDFEYAWKRALDPNTASPYAYQFYYLKNAEAYNTGKSKVDGVGVKASDDNTLQVDLENPTGYFLSLVAFPAYAPIRKDIVEKNPKDWATKPDTYVCNGPFKMKEWKAKDTLTFIKNDNYWNAKSVTLKQIDYRLLDDETAYMNAFKSGQIDFIETPPIAEIQSLIASKTAAVYPYLGTYYLELNMDPAQAKLSDDAQKALKNVKVREALSLAIDRKLLVEKVTKAGQKPATAFVPNGIPDPSTGKDFRQKDYYKATADVTKAKQLLSEAGYPDGKEFPKLEFLYNTSQSHGAVAQAIQDMWRQNLGINITLKNQEWAVFQTTRQNHQFAIARGGWIADYTDPMTFLDIFTTGNGNNDPAYSSKDYDAKIAAARKESDAKKRMQDMHDAEDILMQDMPMIPLYFYTNIVCIKNNIKGFHKSPLGFVFFDAAYVTK